MNLRQLARPITAKSLNESLAKRFGEKINLEQFTLERLENVRNKLRTELSQVETNESFDSYNTEEYQKQKLYLDVLNAEVSERTIAADETDESMKFHKKNLRGKAKRKYKEGMRETRVVKEGEEDRAELIMASKDMVDRLTGWMEDTAEMQTESMLDLADAIRDELGSEQSESFTMAVKPALEQLYASMEETRVALINGVGLLTGEGDRMGMMGADDDMGNDELDMEPTMDGDDDLGVDVDDEFGGAPAADGGEDPAGREKRESRINHRKMIESSRRIGALMCSPKKK
jgi:hypothetical protein